MEMFCCGLDIEAVLITFVLLLGVIMGKKDTTNTHFPILLLLNALTILTNIGTIVFQGNVGNVILLKACLVAECAFLFAGIVGFNRYVDDLLGYRIGGENFLVKTLPYAIAVLAIILWASSLYTGWFFTVTDDREVQYSSFFLGIQIVGVFLGLFPVLRIIVNQMLDNIEGHYAVSIYMFVLIPALSLPLVEMVHGLGVLLAAMTISYVVMYISIHVRAANTQLLEQADYEKRQTSIVMSQLQPHFIINSLTTIRYLCSSNPMLAMEALGKFTTYMRVNMDTIGGDELVTFKDELEHIKNYIWLEQLRFGSSLRVQYSIDVEDFMIPPLSIQPIVENAIKHGITKKIGGGTVTIAVRETDNYYKITVSDDGVGFERQEISSENSPHIGIEDVRKRISVVNGSTLSVTSKVGIGTSVVYEIMKESQ